MADNGTVRQIDDFGKTFDHHTAHRFELDNGQGLKATVTTLGATILTLDVPDRRGDSANVLLGPADVGQINSPKSPYLGALVGRVANRISGGRFSLDGKQYQLTRNDGGSTLHGGKHGYNTRHWKATPLSGASLQLTLIEDSSADGFAGIVTVKVVYTLTAKNAWRIEYEATTTEPTPINLTQHAYFNLKDAGRSDILDHVVKINAQDYTVNGPDLVANGEIKPVAGTPFDFTSPKPIGRDIGQLTNTPRGYDINYVIAAAAGPLREIAEVTEPTTGRRMIVRTTEPGVQLYSGNFLDGTFSSPNGYPYNQYTGLCLETQHFPNAVNVPSFPNTILRPGETFRSVTEYEFSAQ